MARRRTKPAPARQRPSTGARDWLLAIVVLGGIFLIFRLWSGSTEGAQPGVLAGIFDRLSGTGRTRIGIVAGHWQHDSGAVCADGLEEVSINTDVAERVATLLRRAGYAVDVMAEFDPALQGYEADVFLSIHCDSCIEGLSGFKIARLPDSQVADRADRLVSMLYTEYEAVTGLQPHFDTITYDMREYHAFREITPHTPGAIIELGFMGEDRDLLTGRPDLVARGIARGIIAFIRAEQETPATPSAGG